MPSSWEAPCKGTVVWWWPQHSAQPWRPIPHTKFHSLLVGNANSTNTGWNGMLPPLGQVFCCSDMFSKAGRELLRHYSWPLLPEKNSRHTIKREAYQMRILLSKSTRAPFFSRKHTPRQLLSTAKLIICSETMVTTNEQSSLFCNLTRWQSWK